jgi:hypothetical protein
MRGAGGLPLAEEGPFAQHLDGAGGGILVLRSGSREGFFTKRILRNILRNGHKNIVLFGEPSAGRFRSFILFSKWVAVKHI